MTAISTRRALRPQGARMHIRAALIALGVPEHLIPGRSTCAMNTRVRRRTFKCATYEELVNLYYVARSVYRTRIRCVHPDVGGTVEQAARINLLWSRIKKLFAAHGITE